jgi:MFS family permease
MNGSRGDGRELPPALFTIFWVAQAISLFGDRLNNFSLVALINRFSDTPGLTLSQIYLAMYLPIFTLAPLIGVAIDRLNKRWVLVVTDLCRGLLVISIPLLFASTQSFLPVMAIVFLLTTGNLFFLPAKSGLIPELVRSDRLIRVNSILWAAGIAGVAGGFLGGGLIFDYLSWRACFYIDGATYLLSAVLLIGIAFHCRNRDGLRSNKTVEHPPLLAAVKEGLKAIKGSVGLRRSLGIQSLVFFGAGGLSVLAIVLIRDASPPGSSMGLSFAGLAMGLGMGAGSLFINRITLTREKRNRIKMSLFAVLFPAFLAIGSGLGIVVISVGCILSGFAAAPLVIISESELQRQTHEAVRGRVFSVREVLTRSLFLASAFLMNWLGELVGKDTLCILLGLFLACMGIIWIGLTKQGPRAGTGE